MRLKTRAFDLSKREKWTIDELSRRSGLSCHMLKSLSSGRRGCGPRAIAGLRQAFPHINYDYLFYFEGAPGTNGQEPHA